MPSKPQVSVSLSPEASSEPLYVELDGTPIAAGFGQVVATPTLTSVTRPSRPHAVDAAAPPAARGLAATLAATVRALRPHQWAKNLLIFVPLVLSHRFFEPGVLAAGILAFFAFGLCASSIYVINDLCDIEADRAHPRKRFRPFAARELSVGAGVGLAAVLLAASLGLALFGASREFVFILLAYIAVTSAYSWRLKREPVLDVFVLATLYVVRVLGGGAAAGITISNWLLGFALFLFLSLAFVKRYIELLGQQGHMPGRGYNAADHGWMLSIGTAAGYMSVVILALYVNSDEVARLYASPRVLWLTCPLLLYWVSRVWFRAGRQQVHDDPVLDALKDPTSYLCAVAALAILVIAL